MTVIKHIFQSSIADDPTAASNGEVLPSHWNADHTLLDVVVGAPLYGDSEGEIAQSSAEFYTEATEASILAAATAANAAGGRCSSFACRSDHAHSPAAYLQRRRLPRHPVGAELPRRADGGCRRHDPCR